MCGSDAPASRRSLTISWTYAHCSCAHALAPHVHRRGHLLDRQLGQRQHRLGPVDDHLVRARRRQRAEQLARPAAPSSPGAASAVLRVPRRALRRGERRIQVRHDAHASSPASRERRRPGAPRRARAACGPRGPRRTGRARGRSARARARSRTASARHRAGASARRRRSSGARSAGRCGSQACLAPSA